MCHLILLLPVLALPVFWFLPLFQAVAVYGVVTALSLWVYRYLLKAMHRPVQIGVEALLGREGEVVDTAGGQVLVRVASETWTARSRRPVAVGDRVRVVRVDGLVLELEPAGTGAAGRP